MFWALSANTIKKGNDYRDSHHSCTIEQLINDRSKDNCMFHKKTLNNTMRMPFTATRNQIIIAYITVN